MRFLLVVILGGAFAGWLMRGGTQAGTIAGICVAACIGISCAAMEGR